MPAPYDAHSFLGLLGIEITGEGTDAVGRLTVTHSAKEGEAVFGQATPLHLGRTTQVWDASVTNQKTERQMAAYRCTQLISYG